MPEKDFCQDFNSNSKSRDRLGSSGWSGGRRRQLELTWTNFHCALCLGVSGFIIFWIFILARMYLPLESAIMTWWLGKKVPDSSSQALNESSTSYNSTDQALHASDPLPPL